MNRMKILMASIIGLALLGAALRWSGASAASTQERGQGTKRPASINTEPRLALVIGNASYKEAPLTNPLNDARDMAAALRSLSFEVLSGIDRNQQQMKELIRQFGLKLRQGGVGLFYFAGHGVQVGGRNYLLPIGVEINSEAEVEYEAVEAGFVLAQMEEARNRLNVVILDACRNNPFARSFRSGTRGLAGVRSAPSGTLIAYATAADDVAADGNGRNGLFTGELLAQIKTPGLTLAQVFQRTRTNVRSKSGGKQVPFEYRSVEGEEDFYFIRSNEPPAPTPTPTSAQPQEIAVKKQEQQETNDPKPQPKQDLVEAVLEGNIGAVQDLLGSGADVNAKGKYGYTPLTAAVSQCSYVMVKTLLAKGADINAKAEGGYTALMSVLDSFQFVNGCGVTDSRVAQALTDAQSDVNVKDNDGKTLLMYALSYDRVPDQIVDTFLAKGAKVNEKDNKGNTALMLCTNERRARALIDKEADINAKNNRGETILAVAVSRGRADVVALLIDKGADINVKDNDGKTLLIRAADSPFGAAIKLLLDKGLNVNAKDNQGRTALMTAVNSSWYIDVAMIQALLDKGADVNAKDNKGWTALLLAEEKRKSDVVEMLKKAGAK
jgi:ankyrin repeat protein